MDRDHGLAAAGTTDDDMGAALTEPSASGTLDDPQHLPTRHHRLAY
jgi:hypothetical protein